MASFRREVEKRRIFLVAAALALGATVIGLVFQALLGSDQTAPERVTQSTLPENTQTLSEALSDRSTSAPLISSESRVSAGLPSESTRESTEPTSSANTQVVPIPIPGRLLPLFEGNDGRFEDRTTAHAQLEAEPRESAWATFNETEIANFLGDKLDSQNFEILSLQCRTQMCEVLLVGYGEPIDGGPRHTAVDSFYASVMVPELVEAPWFGFTGMELAFEPLDSGAVGLQLVLRQSSELVEGQATISNGENPAISDSANDLSERVPSEDAVVQSIPIPVELEELFGRNNDWSEFHERLEREPDNLSWSTFIEGQIAEYFDSLPGFVGHDLLLAECRTSSCEIQLMIPYASNPGSSLTAGTWIVVTGLLIRSL